jgi:eukaryotic-like serine/threonine-protein kinase
MLAKALDGRNAQQVTRPGAILGEVNYLSPERTAGDPSAVDVRSDLFSLGATAYALLCGQPPFGGATLVETIQQIRNAEPRKPSTFQMGIPTSFEGAVVKLLSKRPSDRYQTATELLTELANIGRANGAKA